MGGGGARAAYQVGMLRTVARHYPNLEVPIITGVSAGAINAVHLAAHPGTFEEAVEDLARLWSDLTVDQVFRVEARTLLLNTLRWGLQLISGGMVGAPEMKSLMDVSPLRGFLGRKLHVGAGRIPGIEEKIASGRLHALALSTSSYTTGRSVTWIQAADEVEEWERPLRRSRRTRMTLDHILASAAIPLFFPAVEIDGEWFGDGGIRLSAPLSPAVHLGATRLLSISTRFDRTSEEAARPVVEGYPPPAQVIGQMLNAIFLDLVDQDAWRVERMNRLLRRLPPEDRDGHRIVEIMNLRPSMDLGLLANEFEFQLPRTFRFLVRGLGTRRTRSQDLLSFLLFEPDYLQRMMEVGRRDAESRMGELEALLDPDGARPPPPLPPAGRRPRRRAPTARSAGTGTQAHED
jgi:NTE family protein